MSVVGSPRNFHLNRCRGKGEVKEQQQNGFVVAEGFLLRTPAEEMKKRKA